jgi:hypothetical protein
MTQIVALREELESAAAAAADTYPNRSLLFPLTTSSHNACVKQKYFTLAFLITKTCPMSYAHFKK